MKCIGAVHDAGPSKVARSAGSNVADVPSDHVVEKIRNMPIFDRSVS